MCIFKIFQPENLLLASKNKGAAVKVMQHALKMFGGRFEERGIYALRWGRDIYASCDKGADFSLLSIFVKKGEYFE